MLGETIVDTRRGRIKVPFVLELSDPPLPLDLDFHCWKAVYRKADELACLPAGRIRYFASHARASRDLYMHGGGEVYHKEGNKWVPVPVLEVSCTISPLSKRIS
jgi:hypothetical protein